MKRLAPLVLLLALTAGCTDNNLATVAKSLAISAQSISVVQTTIIDANRQGLVNDADTAAVLKVCLTVNQAGKDAVGIIKPLTALDLNSKQMILKVITPAVQSVQKMLEANLLFIKNEDTKQKVRAALLTVESALNAVQLAVAVGG